MGVAPLLHTGLIADIEQHTTVAPLYDFAALGAGAFDFEPVTTFQVVDATADVAAVPNAFRVASGKVRITVTGDVARREVAADALAKRATTSCSSSSKASFISSRCVFLGRR